MNTIKPVETEPKSNAKSLGDWQSIRLVVELSLPLPTVDHHGRILLSSVSDNCCYRRHGMPYLNSFARFLVSSVSVFFKYTYILKYVLFWEDWANEILRVYDISCAQDVCPSRFCKLDGAIFRIAFVTQRHLDGRNIDSRQVTASGKFIVHWNFLL